MKSVDDLMAHDWAAAFRVVDPDIDDKIARMGDFLRQEIKSGYKILPEPNNIFRAFSRPLTDAKVLIVGQDPYPTLGHPVGLSFSVPPTVNPLPGSLRNIFKELDDDSTENPTLLNNARKNNNSSKRIVADNKSSLTPKTGDLSGWFGQGVVLLNRSLTVRAGKPNSHAGRGWEEITEDAVKILANRDEIISAFKNDALGDEKRLSYEPLVVMLWGRNARSLAPFFAEKKNILTIESAHPSPLSAYNGFFGSRPFSKANRFLIDHGAAPIDWAL